MEQFVLAHPEMSTEVIADGEHLSKELLQFAYQMKGAARLCLVTDSNRALDMPPGRYWFGPNETGSWFDSDGRVGFVPGKGLASAVVGMDHMIRVMRAGVFEAFCGEFRHISERVLPFNRSFVQVVSSERCPWWSDG